MLRPGRSFHGSVCILNDCCGPMPYNARSKTTFRTDSNNDITGNTLGKRKRVRDLVS